MTKQNLNDKPFEYRIRVKYFYFGLLLGIVAVATLYGSSSLISLILDYMNIHFTDKVISATDIKQKDATMLMFTAIFSPLIIWLWYSKSKPKKHPDNEEIGLKYDWDKVNKI